MNIERIVYTYDLAPDKGFRILAHGEFDAEMVSVLQAFAEFMGTITPKKSVTEIPEEITGTAYVFTERNC